MSSAESEHGGPATAGLVQAVLDAEAERRAEQAAAAQEVVLPTTSFPGVGRDRDRAARRRAARRRVHRRDARVAPGSSARSRTRRWAVLAPNIRDTFHVSDGVIVFVDRGVGRVPRARRAADGLARRPLPARAGHRLGDRRVLGDACSRAVRRRTRSGSSSARLGVGFAKSNTYPVQGSLIADAYPIGVRGRVNATRRAARAAWPRC